MTINASRKINNASAAKPEHPLQQGNFSSNDDSIAPRHNKSMRNAVATNAVSLSDHLAKTQNPGRFTEFSLEHFFDSVANQDNFTRSMETLLTTLEKLPADERNNIIEAMRTKQEQMGRPSFREAFHFCFPDHDALMAGGIEFQSVFSSEEWSKVMIEGIKKSHESIRGKDLVDVGCGNFCFGKTALQQGAHSVRGTDINPDAIVNAKINQLLFNNEIAQPVDISDLLGTLINENAKVDTIIACIPQIVDMNADSESTDADTIAKTSLMDRERHSHLAPPAGGKYAEFDAYGLGLVARLLEQAPRVLKPKGQLLMNVADRPGKHIINTMFQQFDCEFTPVVEKVFAQQTTGDETVDLSFFTNMEKKNGITFSFFADQACQQQVNANEAQQLLHQGRSVYHSLTCYKVTPTSVVEE